ncbi:MAG: F0F1 ATP synthase subunit B [Acholeplasmatales bacterium]|jgi:F-type H+-transporting ATPase subunit b|nr:F0F1 ATP synthase subunit B [Acholeplasmatales bacterium]
MILSINDAIDEIVSTVTDALGPLANLTTATAADWLGYLAEIGIQLVSTIILFLAVRFFLWKPITKILEERRDAIDKELTEAQAAKENSIQIEQELLTEREKAKAEIKALISKAEHDANIQREAIINDAKAEAKRRLDNLENELIQEKANMEADIKKEIVDIAFEAAEKIVAKEIDREKYMDFINDFLEEAK